MAEDRGQTGRGLSEGKVWMDERKIKEENRPKAMYLRRIVTFILHPFLPIFIFIINFRHD